MSVSVSVSVSVCVHACMRARMNVCVCCVRACMHACVHAFVAFCASRRFVPLKMCVCVAPSLALVLRDSWAFGGAAGLSV